MSDAGGTVGQIADRRIPASSAAKRYAARRKSVHRQSGVSNHRVAAAGIVGPSIDKMALSDAIKTPSIGAVAKRSGPLK